jgi:hypothetical protein
MVPDGGRQSAAARVAGRLVACFLDGIEGSSLDRATAERRLADAGIATVREDEWYPLVALDTAYRRGHRGDAGGYGFRQIGPTDGFVRLAEASTCRDDGADRCTDELSW